MLPHLCVPQTLRWMLRGWGMTPYVKKSIAGYFLSHIASYRPLYKSFLAGAYENIGDISDVRVVEYVPCAARVYIVGFTPPASSPQTPGQPQQAARTVFDGIECYTCYR